MFKSFINSVVNGNKFKISCERGPSMTRWSQPSYPMGHFTTKFITSNSTRLLSSKTQVGKYRASGEINYRPSISLAWNFNDSLQGQFLSSILLRELIFPVKEASGYLLRAFAVSHKCLLDLFKTLIKWRGNWWSAQFYSFGLYYKFEESPNCILMKSYGCVSNMIYIQYYSVLKIHFYMKKLVLLISNNWELVGHFKFR